MTTRKKSYPVIEVDARRTADLSTLEHTSSMTESHDDPEPQKLIDPEREHIYQDLREHNDQLRNHEQRIRVLESSQSMPVTFNGPKGFSVTGSWRVVLAISSLASVVAIAYFVFHYLTTK
jgi:hypothetical protein